MDERIHINDLFNGCLFPLNFKYDTDNNIWVHLIENNLAEIGLLPITQFTIGKIISVKVKPKGYNINLGDQLLLIESRKFLGYVYSPLSGVIEEINEKIIAEPWIIQTMNYENNWIIKMRLSRPEELSLLSNSTIAINHYKDLIQKKSIVCFKVPPDFVYPAIGVECSQVIMILSDIISQLPLGATIHVVADYNPGSEIELLEWEKITGNKVLEIYIEKIGTKGIIHGLIQKIH